MYLKNYTSKKLSPLAILLFFLFSLALTMTPKASAETYDIYIDINYKDDGDGTPEKPFSKLSKGIKEALSRDKDSRKIYLKKGEYEESITLDDYVQITGEDKDKTIIKNSSTGTFDIQKNALLKNITISNGYSAITIHQNADIRDCIIKDSTKNAINMLPGEGKVTLRSNKIVSNGKGMYVQAGKNVSVINNEVSRNHEEGIDLREKVSAKITGNSIFSNGESGIELVIGSSEILIKDNSIKKNKSSGIATQFYDIAKKTGEIKIEDNIITNNKEYGITCGTPSGGNPSKNYWENSLSINTNKIEENGGKDIAGKCSSPQETEEITTIKNEIEIIPAKIEKVLEAEPTQDEQRSLNVLQAEIVQKESENRLIFEESLSNTQTLSAVVQKKAAELKSRSSFKIFFIGANEKTLAELKNNIQPLKASFENTKALSQGVTFEENKAFANQNIYDMENKLSEYENTIKESEQKFSLFGWMFKYFSR